MESIKTRGLIIRTSDYGENSRMLSIFTEDFGIISATVYGATSKKKGMGAESRIFTFAEFLLKKSNGRLRCEEIKTREGFFPLSEDIEKLSLAVYLSDLAYASVGPENSDLGVLRLLLNTIYAVCYSGVDPDIAKTVYELRLAKEGGYMPCMEFCLSCGEDISGDVYFDIQKGGVVCSKCKLPFSQKLTKAQLDALKFIFSAEDKKIFSFKTTGDVFTCLSQLSEKYILNHLEQSFKSLEYYKKIKN
ncbi:MAG: DNA repair protein RecO [Clostridia bacterium]|nr:DNA repair protein RecO [Clostridia bacterium]